MNTEILHVFNKEWALLTAGTPEHFNTMTVSWGGLGTLWSRPVCTVYVRPNRYTYQFMEESDLFTVSFYPRTYRGDLGILGSRSGRDGDKIAFTQLTPKPLPGCVTFEEASTTFVCRKLYRQDMDASQIPANIMEEFYGSDPVHRMYIAEVLDTIQA